MPRADRRWPSHRTIIMRSMGCMMLITFWFTHGVFLPEATAVTVEEYCQLVIEILETSVDEWHERLSMVRQGAAQQRSYLDQLGAVGRRYEAIRRQLFDKYGTNAGEYVSYMGVHGTAVRQYISSHEPVQRLIEDLTTQVQSLVDRYEAALRK
jgi:hypothetical protein